VSRPTSNHHNDYNSDSVDCDRELVIVPEQMDLNNLQDNGLLDLH